MFGLKIKILSEDEEVKQKLDDYYEQTNGLFMKNKMQLSDKNIKIEDYTEIKNYIFSQDIDSSGLDIIMPKNIIIPAKSMGIKIKLGISCEPITIYKKGNFEDSTPYDNEGPIVKFYYKLAKCGYYLYPRSSLSKTPLRLANSVGIIDSSYRGELIAAVDNISEEDFDIKQGQRLFQLCSPTLEPINYIVTKELSETDRGEGGFGSTGK